MVRLTLKSSKFMMIDSLKICYQNFNGVTSKLQDLRREVYHSDYDIICGTESKIQSGFLDSELCPSDAEFILHRRDRDLSTTNKVGGGGCIALTKKHLRIRRLHHLELLTTNEDLWLSVALPARHEVYICLLYLKPTTSLDEFIQFYENVTRVKDSLSEKT